MGLKFLSYKIPFSRPFSTVHKKFTFREGIILTLNKNRITALGEAAPLPGFSRDTLDEVKTQIQNLKPAFGEFFRDDFSLQGLKKFNDEYAVKPSLCFGLFTVAATYLAQKNKQSIHHFLFSHANRQIQLNAVINLNESILPQVRKHANAGFKTLKLKTGTNWSKTLSKIERVRDEFESLNIRLDTNRSWRPDEAQTNLKQAEPYEIEFCEEPLKNPAVQHLQALKNHVSVPIALDETMAGWPDINEKALIADILIIKPMVIGGREKIKTICNFAAENNKRIVFTSSLGTAVERLMTATLAAGCGSKNLAHGLNTAGLLETDVWDDENFIQNGVYTLPDARQLKQLMQSDLQPLSPEIL